MDEKKPEKIEDLKTLKEFAKKLPEGVKQLYVSNRWGELIGRYTVADAVKTLGHRKVFNYFDKEKGIVDVYVSD